MNSFFRTTKSVAYLTIFLGILTKNLLAQNPKSFGSGVKPVQTMVNTAMHDTCLNKTFSIVFYFIKDTGTIVNATFMNAARTTVLNKLNNAFSRICVKFQACSTVVIPNSLWNTWSHSQLANVAINSYSTANTINLFLPMDLVTAIPGENSAYTYSIPPLSSNQFTDAVVIDVDALNDGNVEHVFGHFFGLPHTYAEIDTISSVSPLPPTNNPPIKSREWVKRGPGSNCYTHGDGFCDTEADPFPAGTGIGRSPSIEGCGPVYGLKDGNGDYYFAPVDNFMSEYTKCRCRFSQEQYNYMAGFIVTRKLYLH